MPKKVKRDLCAQSTKGDGMHSKREQKPMVADEKAQSSNLEIYL